MFTFGVAQLAIVSRPLLGFRAALAAGFFPFVIADLLKIVLAAAVLPSVWRFTGRRSY